MIMALLSGQGQNIIIYTAACWVSITPTSRLPSWTARPSCRRSRIVFPLVKPTTPFLLVTGVIGSFQVFMNAYT